MPVVGDFKIINDGKITLKWNSPNSAEIFKFSLPGLLKGSPAVLAFVCIAKGNTGALGNLAFEMSLNGSEELGYGFSAFEIMSLHEAISGSALNATSNQLSIKMLSGDGQLEIGDLILWYKKTV
jgi:hypothetical protein